MEQARLLLAIVLSFMVFFLWNVFFVDHEKQRKPKREAQTEVLRETPRVADKPRDRQPEKRVEEKTAAKKEAVGIPAGKPPVDRVETRRNIQVETPLYTVTIAEKGAVFKSFVLHNYRENIEADSARLNMISGQMNPGSLKLGFEDKAVQGWRDASFTADVRGDVLRVVDAPQKVLFEWRSEDGVVVEKIFTFSPDTYLIDLVVNIRNGTDLDLREPFFLSLTKHLPENKTRYGFEGLSTLINGDLEQIDEGDIEEKNVYSGTLGWVALQDRYFLSAVVPETPTKTRFRVSLNENRLFEGRYVQPVGVIGAMSAKTFDYQVYFGPKSLKILNQYDSDLNEAVYFGWFDVIAKPCVYVMNFFYGFIPNYGVSIIIMTLLIKILLWPLGTKSYKSMAEMKKIQPLVTELKEKYKDDKKKMNEEMMKLYRVYKVNPLGGCLPMALQIPVFIALYRMLYEAIELRHAPFVGWINDLSAPDRLFRFDFSIPFMQPPYGIPVLTIIMGATMLLQQKMSPPPGDPTQAKMMMFMPIVFTVIFINFSSGLVLYWLVSNVLSIAQQYYVQKKQA